MPDERQQLEFPEAEDVREIELPRRVRVPIGLILSLFTLLCGFASAYLLFVPNKKAPVLALVVGVILLLGCVWMLERCFRLITGRKKRGGLMSPRVLRVVSFCILVLPVVGLFTGYYRETGAIAIFQAVMYFSAFWGFACWLRSVKPMPGKKHRSNSSRNASIREQ